jgi:hypothetical protein
MKCWMLVAAWAGMNIFWGLAAAAIGWQAFLGFALGIISTIATSLACGLAAASVFDRSSRGDWEPD